MLNIEWHMKKVESLWVSKNFCLKDGPEAIWYTIMGVAGKL